MLMAGVLTDGVYESAIAGVPQGGVASPLLSNIYLHIFDVEMERAGFALTRYADDWVTICRSRAEAERALASARAVLEGKLGFGYTRKRHASFTLRKDSSSSGTRSDGAKGVTTKPEDRPCTRFPATVRFNI